MLYASIQYNYCNNSTIMYNFKLGVEIHNQLFDGTQNFNVFWETDFTGSFQREWISNDECPAQSYGPGEPISRGVLNHKRDSFLWKCVKKGNDFSVPILAWNMKEISKYIPKPLYQTRNIACGKTPHIDLTQSRLSSLSQPQNVARLHMQQRNVTDYTRNGWNDSWNVRLKLLNRNERIVLR
jgi:hypothetical protein